MNDDTGALRQQVMPPHPRGGWRDAGFDTTMTLLNWAMRLPGHTVRLAVARRLGRLEVGPGTIIERGLHLYTLGGVSIGAHCIINSHVALDGRGGLRIGDRVNLSAGVSCLTADHDPDSPGFTGRLAGVSIASQTWLATGCLVLPGCSVGEGAVVGAGSVVAGDIPPWSIAAGVPARVIRPRDTEAQQSLGRYRRRWWH